MKKKILYYTVIALITAICIFIYMEYMDFFHKPIKKYKTAFIINQKIAPDRLYINAWKNAKKHYIDPEMNGQDWYRWKNKYLDYIETEEDAKIAINTMLYSLNDPYSKFMSLPEFEYQNIQLDSIATGIGISLMEVAKRLVVTNVILNSPAQNAGIQIGDIIVKIDDKNTSKMALPEAISLIKGKIYTPVKLELLRNNKIITKTVMRDLIKYPSVYYKMFDKDIAYIQVASFMGKTVYKEFEYALKQAINAKGLIIDLRGDSGGLLTNAVSMSNMIIDKGNILSVIYRNGIKITMPSDEEAFYKDKPIVILVNKGTASAAEILTGALRDNVDATIVGQKTYGKNSIQQIIPMQNHTGMNLTIAKYLMPNDEDIHNKGIMPHYTVAFTTDGYDERKDVQLNKAKEVLNQKIKKQSLKPEK